ncbi:MAG: IGHMBP2 family helicase [Bacteroidota bacterium]
MEKSGGNTLPLRPMSYDAINQQLTQLKAILKKEKEEDLERYRREIKDLTIAEKQERGLCWYPLQIKKQDYTFGDRAFVVFERTTQRDEPHRFKAGAPVDLYSLADDKFSKANNRSQSGVVHYIEKNRMKVILNTKDLPDWLHNGQLGVDFLFDERTYIEMDKALNKLIKSNEGRLSELKAIFYGAMQPKFGALPELQHPYLNDTQLNAVQHILAAQDVAIVHGPPGTGKTTTLVHAIERLAHIEPKILVTAPSNTAVDFLAERLADKGLKVVRIGNISRVDEKLIHLTLDSQLSQHPESQNIKKVKIQAAKARRKAHQFKRRFGDKERRNRRDARREAKELEDWARHLEDMLIGEILSRASIIACTLVNANHSLLERFNFQTLIIDEAAQALEPACWIPISKVEKVVLAGDPFQLPPTIKSNEARRQGLGITLLEKAVEQFPSVSFLAVQYRMNRQIMGFSSTRFYKDQLIAAEMVAEWRLPIANNTPILFIDTAGAGFDEKVNPETNSRYNAGEFFILREHFLKLAQAFEETATALPSIAIISPYRAQCMHIEEELAEDHSLHTYIPHLDIKTIDGFQGQERDLVYISLVRSNGKGEIGFLSDYRRMNVAMTRARKQLVVIGDSATIGNDPFYEAFLEYVEREGQYGSAWEYMA